MIHLKELREKAEKASPGPWHIGHVSESCSDPNRIGELADIEDFECCVVAQVEWRRDQAYLCDANPETMKALLDCLEIYREALEWQARGSAFNGFDHGNVACEALEKVGKVIE